MRTKIAFLFQLLLLLTFTISCTDEEQDIVPDVYVRFDFHVNSPEYTNLLVPLGAVKRAGVGFNNNGVIVFRTSDYGYQAFDATCPQHITNSTSVNINANESYKATCPYCNTVYYLSNNGFPTKGYKLKQYRVTVSGEIVYVSN